VLPSPLLSFSQKTYKWGKSRPDAYRSRETFPGLAPWVGIHAFDWLHWILGEEIWRIALQSLFEGPSREADLRRLREGENGRARSAAEPLQPIQYRTTQIGQGDDSSQRALQFE